MNTVLKKCLSHPKFVITYFVFKGEHLKLSSHYFVTSFVLTMTYNNEVVHAMLLRYDIDIIYVGWEIVLIFHRFVKVRYNIVVLLPHISWDCFAQVSPQMLLHTHLLFVTSTQGNKGQITILNLTLTIYFWHFFHKPNCRYGSFLLSCECTFFILSIIKIAVQVRNIKWFAQ